MAKAEMVSLPNDDGTPKKTPSVKPVKKFAPNSVAGFVNNFKATHAVALKQAKDLVKQLEAMGQF
jgi:hypothetical protein